MDYTYDENKDKDKHTIISDIQNTLKLLITDIVSSNKNINKNR